MERGSGILLPIFSLKSKYGIGTFGSEAYNFVDFLEKIVYTATIYVYMGGAYLCIY